MSKNLLLSITIALVFCISCTSSYYKKSETINEKMKRYKTRGLGNNHVPSFKILKDHNLGGASRSLASTSENLEQLNYSNKKLYFLSLYSQYEKLKSFIPKSIAQNINICPSFHSSILDYKNMSINNKAKSHSAILKREYTKNINNKNIQVLYPELSLPMHISEKTPTAFDLIFNKVHKNSEAQKIITKAFRINVNKIHRELNELCQTGSSSNYYIYENLITHIQSSGKLKKNNKGLSTLFKLSLFSNMVLINSMDSLAPSIESKRMPASLKTTQKHNIFEYEVIGRLGVSWTNDYFLKVRQLRKANF